MNIIYTIFLFYSSFILYTEDNSDDKLYTLKIFMYMIVYNPLHTFINQKTKILNIVVIGFLFIFKYFIHIQN